VKTIILEAEFSAAHFYYQPKWTDEKNHEEFGRCFTKYGHGHNYKLRAEWAQVLDSEITDLKKHLNSVVSVLDHEHLNFTIPEFKNKIPTTEVILEYLESKLRQGTSYKLVNLELFETPEIGARLKE
jgi:6-pyruvoyltetrahydropterin/6-carboxytetrahydropterin synthase